MVYIVHVLIALQQSIRQRLSSDQIYRWFFSNKHLLLSWLIRFFLCIWPSPMIQHYCPTFSRWRIVDCIRGTSVERSGCYFVSLMMTVWLLCFPSPFLWQVLLYCREKTNRCVKLIGSLIFITISEHFPTISSLQHIQVLKTSTGKKKKRWQELLCFALYEWLVNKRWYWFSKKKFELLFMVF